MIIDIVGENARPSMCSAVPQPEEEWDHWWDFRVVRVHMKVQKGEWGVGFMNINTTDMTYEFHLYYWGSACYKSSESYIRGYTLSIGAFQATCASP